MAPQSGESFAISGATDAQNAFNRLAKVYEVTLGNDLQARDYANLYLRIDPLHNQIKKIDSLLAMKQAAEKELANTTQDFGLAQSQFAKWWSKNESALGRMSLAENLNATDTGFVFSFMTLSSIDKKRPEAGPSPLKVTIKISKTGQVEPPVFTPVALD